MPDNVVASIPLGWILAAAALIGLIGLVCGWQITLWRERKKSARARRAILEHAEAWLNSLPEATLLVDADGRIVAQNASAGQIVKEFAHQGGLPQQITQAVGRTLRSGIAETIEISTPGAAARRFQVFVTPLVVGESGGESGGEALVLFMSPRNDNGRTELSQRLTRNLAHELRTPLTAILGHVEILNSCEITEETLWRRSLGFVSSETERLARLVEDMLYLSRLERAPLDIQPVNLHLVAEEAIATLCEQTEKNKVTVVLQAPHNLPRANADPDRIRQVFINLLDNAIKYAPGCTVTIHLAAQQNLLHVQFHDTGPGVSAEDLPHIFEPFFRSKQTAIRERGSGLGLAIVQTILEQHHAPILATSSPAEGACFAFSLPAESFS